MSAVANHSICQVEQLSSDQGKSNVHLRLLHTPALSPDVMIQVQPISEPLFLSAEGWSSEPISIIPCRVKTEGQDVLIDIGDQYTTYISQYDSIKVNVVNHNASIGSAIEIQLASQQYASGITAKPNMEIPQVQSIHQWLWLVPLIILIMLMLFFMLRNSLTGTDKTSLPLTDVVPQFLAPTSAVDDRFIYSENDMLLDVLANDVGQSITIITISDKELEYGSAKITEDGKQIQYTRYLPGHETEKFSYEIVGDDGVTKTANIIIEAP